MKPHKQKIPYFIMHNEQPLLLGAMQLTAEFKGKISLERSRRGVSVFTQKACLDVSQDTFRIWCTPCKGSWDSYKMWKVRNPALTLSLYRVLCDMREDWHCSIEKWWGGQVLNGHKTRVFVFCIKGIIGNFHLKTPKH